MYQVLLKIICLIKKAFEEDSKNEAQIKLIIDAWKLARNPLKASLVLECLQQTERS